MFPCVPLCQPVTDKRHIVAKIQPTQLKRLDFLSCNWNLHCIFISIFEFEILEFGQQLLNNDDECIFAPRFHCRQSVAQKLFILDKYKSQRRLSSRLTVVRSKRATISSTNNSFAIHFMAHISVHLDCSLKWAKTKWKKKK